MRERTDRRGMSHLAWHAYVGLTVGMPKTHPDCCADLCCGARAEAGWWVRWWRVRVPARVGAIGRVSRRVRPPRAAQRHTDGRREYISPTLYELAAMSDVHEAAGGGRSDAGCVWVSAAWRRRSVRSDWTGLVRRVRSGRSGRRGGWVVDVVEEKVERKWQRRRRAGGSTCDGCAARHPSGRCDGRTHRRSPAATTLVGGSVSAASIAQHRQGSRVFF
jgi:hypothetical protein